MANTADKWIVLSQSASQGLWDIDTRGLNRYCFCLNWPQVSSDQQQINTIENKCSWSTDFLLCWVTSIYLVSSLAQPGQNVFVCRAFKVNSQHLTLSFLRGPDCTMTVMESSIQGVKIIVLHLLAHRTCILFDHFYVDNWDSWNVQHCSCAAPSTTHSHPSHSGGNILINTENILRLSVCLYLCYSSTLFVCSPQRKDISLSLSVTVKSQLSLVTTDWL